MQQSILSAVVGAGLPGVPGDLREKAIRMPVRGLGRALYGSRPIRLTRGGSFNARVDARCRAAGMR